MKKDLSMFKRLSRKIAPISGGAKEKGASHTRRTIEEDDRIARGGVPDLRIPQPISTNRNHVRQHQQLFAISQALLVTIAIALVAYTLIAQALTIAPVSWTMMFLQWEPLQGGIIVLGVLRDTLGIWNIVIAALGFACAVLFSRRRGYSNGPQRTHRFLGFLTALGGVGVASTVATTVILAAMAGQLGAGTSPLLPTIPLAGVSGPPDQTITVGTAGTTPLHADLYLPNGAPPSTGWPVVVSIHGGGFSTGTKAPNSYTGFLPEHGYAVLDVDYRLASPTFHPWQTQVEDIGCSLAWLAANGEEHELDAARIATLGLSSGGNLAINAAYLADSGSLASSCSPPGTALPRIRAVIGGYPAVDLTGIGDQTAVARQVEQYYVGGTPAEYPERYRFVDSANHITSASPPTLIYQGTRDHLVLADRARHFVDLLDQHGVTNRYIEYPGLEHGAGDASATLTYAAAASRELALAWLERYVGEPKEGSRQQDEK